MADLQIRFLDESDVTVLHHHYAGQSQPQQAFLALDIEDGEFWASYDPEIGGGVPESVFQHRTLRWTIPRLTAAAANALLRELAPLARTVLAGAEVHLDAQSNRVGVYTAAANQVIEEIADECEPTRVEMAYWNDIVEELDAADWFIDGQDAAVTELKITTKTTNDEIDTIAGRIDAEALTIADRPTVLTGAVEYLRQARDELVDA